VSVDVGAPPESVFRYLADPRNRPAWQSGLRAVEDVRGTGELGTTWTDVLALGPRPRMAVTACEPFRLWAERGTWRGLAMDLTLRFVSTGGGGRTRLEVTVALETPGVLRPLAAGFAVVGPRAVRADLTRAGRQAEAPAG
jgi:uncharacterized protein YndB with AHSA1/START domain